MQSFSVLEFKLFEDIYCFNAEHVQYVFELESYNEAKGFHESVVGITKYNSNIMLLVDTAKLYSGKSLDFSKEKSVVVIGYDDIFYGMIVDEIVQIEELQEASPTLNLNSEEMVVNHYKKQDDFIQEVDPLPLLKKFAIPAMAHLLTHQEYASEEEQIAEDRESTFYLLFRVSKKYFAIESQYVKEVVEYSHNVFDLTSETKHIKGAIAIRDDVLQILDINEEAETKEDVVVISYEGEDAAIVVDEVYDIEEFSTQEIEHLDSVVDGICGFCKHNEEIIAFLSLDYFIKSSKESHKEVSKKGGVKSHVQREYLVFWMDARRYCLEMKYVRQVMETQALAKTESSAIVTSENVAFLATWNHHAVSIVTLEKLMDLSIDIDNSQTIFIEVEGSVVAFLVQDIENIVYLHEDEVSMVRSEQQSIINGAILYENEVITNLNAKFLTQLVS